jgi:hypothetical protein
MNNEDRKYLRTTERIGPSLEIFNKLVEILIDEQKRIDKLFTAADTFLIKTSKTS